MSNPIDFYFDFSSPYGYFAASKIEDIAARHGREVTWRPILLGAVFKVTGQQPLPTIPLKGDYSKRDLERTARLYNVPFRIPSKFPIGTTAPARAFYYMANKDPALAKRLALALYVAYFADDLDISSPEVTTDIAALAGVDKEEMKQALNDPAVKDRVRREVDAAISLGVFGSPYIVVDGEPFWGADRLDQVEKWLSTGGW
ncbi:MAG TPA: 2-hydroxychromene-2-carboxylate isomerase [Burkholderiales bacterium]|jgi:2-hydroxychromene-2-carboxylate isomerase|nr:2-hydroxychromene-2-carboxylate isomerase [Burkholderiales bacterium]